MGRNNLASGAVAVGGAKPPQGSVLLQALSLANDPQLLQDKKTSHLIKAFVTTQLLHNV